MKNRILLLLFLAGSAQIIFAQKRLSPGIKPFAENWTYTLVKAMHRAGFDMPSMAASPNVANRVTARNSLQLDSTITFFGYAADDTLPVFRTIYNYPFADTRIETESQYENGAWLKLNRSTFVSDSQQRLVEVFGEVFDPVTESFQKESRLEIFPHGDSPVLLDSFYTYLWDSTIQDWQVILKTVNTFDAQDRLLESISALSLFGSPFISRELYSYDNNGDNHRIEEFNVVGDESFPASRTDLVYSDHQLIETTFSTFDGLDFIPESRTNYAYTLFGAVRLQMNFEWKAATANWYMNTRLEYTYDDEQRLSSQETAYLPFNASEEHYLVYYSYVEDENLNEEWFFHWDDERFDWVLDSKKHYYYNGLVPVRPAPAVASALQVWPNPTSGSVEFSLKQEAMVQVFDAGGQLVLSRQIHPDESLNLSALAAGVYTVTARAGADFYSGKVVIQ